MNVSILNLDCGNLSSIYNALKFLNLNVEITFDRKKINNSDAIVLPGNGNFSHVMSFLKKHGFDDLLYENLLIKKKPFLGICIGFQILFSSSMENDVRTNGLNFFNGNLTKIIEKKKTDNFSLPHIGWNNIEIIQPNSIFKNIGKDLDFYFMHNFINNDIKNPYASSICEYGEKFVSSIEKENITAIQFHPEKSHETGINLLREWVENCVKN